MSATVRNELVKERTFFGKLVHKLVGDKKDEQVEFLVKQARKISRTTYIQIALNSIPLPPDYCSLQQRARRNHAHIHRLIDIILPIAAGSESPVSQKQVFQNRWLFLHNQPFISTQVTFQELQHSIKAISNNTEELWQTAELAIKLIPTKVDDSKQNENIEQNINHERRGEILINLTEKIHSTQEEVIRFYMAKVPSINSIT